MHKQQCAVLHMFLVVHKLPQLAAAVEVPHLQLAIVAASQQTALLRVQSHSCQAAAAMTVLKVAFPASCVDIPHADSPTLISTYDLWHCQHELHHTPVLLGHWPGTAECWDRLALHAGLC